MSSVREWAKDTKPRLLPLLPFPFRFSILIYIDSSRYYSSVLLLLTRMFLWTILFLISHSKLGPFVRYLFPIHAFNFFGFDYNLNFQAFISIRLFSHKLVGAFCIRHKNSSDSLYWLYIKCDSLDWISQNIGAKKRRRWKQTNRKK